MHKKCGTFQIGSGKKMILNQSYENQTRLKKIDFHTIHFNI